MSMLIASLMFIPLLALALAHFIWSLGGTWPLRNRDVLEAALVGRRGAKTLFRRRALLGLAALFIAAGVAALALADHTGGGPMLTALGAALALLFLARGLAGYTASWRRTFPDEPFATLDRRNYSPLAFMLGAGFLTLVIMRLL